jgi:hypothetical protein
MYSYTYISHPAAQRVVSLVADRLAKEASSLPAAVVGACTTSLGFSSLDPLHPVYQVIVTTALGRPQEFAADHNVASRLLMVSITADGDAPFVLPIMGW